MEEVVLVIHLFLALAIIVLVLLQRSEGGGLGIGGGKGGLGNVASAKSMDNVLTRATGFCAIAFFCTSLALGVLAKYQSAQDHQILDVLDETPAVVETVIDVEPSDAEALDTSIPEAPKPE